jgi:hypothetical protein
MKLSRTPGAIFDQVLINEKQSEPTLPNVRGQHTPEAQSYKTIHQVLKDVLGFVPQYRFRHTDWLHVCSLSKHTKRCLFEIWVSRY